MYLRRLHLSHVRLFEDDTLSFTKPDNAPRMFTVVVAENGHAKTTLLQAIALVAAGVGGANKLVTNAASYFDKRWVPTEAQREKLEDICEVSADFEFSTSAHALREYPSLAAKLDAPPALHAWLYAPQGWKQFDGDSEFDAKIDRGPHTGRRGGPLDQARAKDLPAWFVAGYGTTRALPLPSSPSDPGNRSIDRLASLFRAEPLIATGFVDVLSRQYGQAVALDYVTTLREVLIGSATLPGLLPRDGAVRLEDLELRGQGEARGSGALTDVERVVLRFGDAEVKVPAVWLSAGYQSTIAWIADLIGQVVLDAGRVIPPGEMEGMVLIDEIDQHLHPRWQATLVPALKETFPRMQFIATTHSPMILPGAASGEVLMLSANERGSVRGEFPTDDPRLLTAAQLYREFFGVQGMFPSPVGDRLRRYGLLAGVAERTADEEREVRALYKQLLVDGVEVWPPEEASHAP